MMLFLDYSCPGRNSRFHYGPRQAGAEFVPMLLLHNTCAAPLGLKCTAPTIPAPPIAAPTIPAPTTATPTIPAPAIAAPTISAPTTATPTIPAPTG